MQNYYQKPIQRVSTELRDRFDDFFLANMRKEKSVTSSQAMPDFQIDMFLNQAIQQRQVVTLTVDSPTAPHKSSQATGIVSRLGNDRLLVKASGSLTYVFTVNQVTFIALH